MTDLGRRRVFGPFVADLSREVLWQDGVVVHITRKTFRVLAVLLRSPGAVVHKREIFEAVWGDVAVEENTLARHVAMLRRALGEGADGPCIVTVPGVGYRFAAPVSDEESPCVDPAPPPLSSASSSAGVGVEQTEPPHRRGPAHPLRWAAAGVVVAAVTIVSFSNGRPSTRTARTTVVDRPLQQVRVTYEPGLQQQPTWSPDSRRVAYASDATGNLDIWVQASDGTSRRQLTSSLAHDSEPAWSPDDREIAFRSERDGGGVFLIDVDGTRERRLLDFGYRPRWSSDSRKILVATADLGVLGVASNLFVVDRDGGPPLPVLSTLTGSLRSISAEFVPGERAVSVWGYRQDGEAVFVTATLDGVVSPWTIAPGARAEFGRAGVRVSQFVWAPSKRYLYFQGQSDDVQNIWRIAIDPASRTITGGLDRLTTSPGVEKHLAISADGRRLAFSERRETRRLLSFPFDSRAGRVTGPGERLTSVAVGDEQDPTVSADGKRLVFRTTRGGRTDVWQLTLADGRERLILSDEGFQRTNPHSSHDGLRLAYARSPSSSQAQQPRSVVLLSSKGGPEQVIGALGLTPTDWAPDGTALVGGCRSPNGLSAVCLLPLSPDAPQRQPRLIGTDERFNLYAPRFSPDKEWITVTAVDPANWAVSTVVADRLRDGMRVTISDKPAWDDKVRWAADGRAIYWVSNRSGRLNVWGRHFDPKEGVPIGPAFPVTSLESPRQGLPASFRGLEVAITADRLIVPITEADGGVWMLDGVDR